LFMHWPIRCDVMRRVVPAQLELDLYNGVAYAGVVPFAMEGVRAAWWPESWALRFLETNVRTYVLYENLPGIYFFSLEASSRLAVWAARCGWSLPYFHAEMRLEHEGDEIRYRSRRRSSGARHDVHCRLGEVLGPSQPGTLEFFFLERYLMFVPRGSRTFVGQVHHVPYPAQRVEILSVEDQLLSAAGLGGCHGGPAFAHYASGVDVEVFGLRPLERSPFGISAGERMCRVRTRSTMSY
jgi:uncharacterized protein YqjF (DUF2071 family)